MKITIECCYTAYADDTVDLKGVKDFGQVKEWFVKWGIFHYTLDGEKWHEINLSSHNEPDIDMKRPGGVRVFLGETHDNEIAEYSD